jgi:hypothetical protein
MQVMPLVMLDLLFGLGNINVWQGNRKRNYYTLD